MKPIKIITGLALVTFGVGYVSAVIETPTFTQAAVPAALLMAVAIGIAIGLEALTEEKAS
jgi:hypothetical protein